MRIAKALQLLLVLFGLPLAASGSASAAASGMPNLPSQAAQGELVIGRALVGSRVWVDEREVRVDAQGRFVFGIARDRIGSVAVRQQQPDGSSSRQEVSVSKRDWPIEHVTGVPPATVDPPPEIAARIAREQAAVAKARERNDARSDFSEAFIWPVTGRISGRFGSARSYNGKPGSPHSGTDVAAATGTPLRAPAAGIVSFADLSLYLTGGTVLLDHGHGVSSVFLHLSRIDVSVGQRVERGDVLGAVGATGRASGPHMHWGLNWFEVRLDPQSIVPPMQH